MYEYECLVDRIFCGYSVWPEEASGPWSRPISRKQTGVVDTRQAKVFCEFASSTFRKLIAYVQRVLSDDEETSPAAVSSTTSSDSDSEDDEDEDLTTEDDENHELSKSARGTGMK